MRELTNKRTILFLKMRYLKTYNYSVSLSKKKFTQGFTKLIVIKQYFEKLRFTSRNFALQTKKLDQFISEFCPKLLRSIFYNLQIYKFANLLILFVLRP